MILRIGRWGEDIEINGPSTWHDRASAGQAQMVHITGDLAAPTLAAMQASRTELLEQVGDTVALTWTGDATRDGFYRLIEADIDVYSLTDSGYATFSADLERIGGVSQVQFQSLITGTVLANDFGVLEAASTPFHAVSVGALTYDTTGAPTSLERSSADGLVPVFVSIPFETDPTWSVSPASYYAGAAEISVGSYIRAGLDTPQDPANFALTNGLIRLTPGTTTGISNGKLVVETYDGTVWDTAKEYGVYWNAVTLIPKWHYVSVIRNTPEVCSIKLIRDASEAPPTASLHELDITLRRGSRYLECLYTWTGAAIAVEIRREVVEAATAIIPTGATGSYGIRATADDASGNRYVIACPHTQVQDLVNGRVRQNATWTMPFMIGAEVGGTLAAVGDTAAEIMLQYIGNISEIVRAVRR